MNKELKKNIILTIVGPSNSGKSTLLNKILGKKIAIVTHKTQTTRSGLKGIAIRKNVQLIFIDTPGIFSGKNKFEKAMVKNALSTLEDSDLILLVVDSRMQINFIDRKLIDVIKKFHSKSLLILNKIDLVKKEDLIKKSIEFNDLVEFLHTFMISAKNGSGVNDLIELAIKKAKSNDWLYPEDQIADTQNSLLSSEVTREKIFLNVHDEIPYLCMVKTEAWDENKKIIKISQTIIVAKKNHIGIILGKNGSKIKRIGIESRLELEKLLDKKIHLSLNVKFKKDWDRIPDNYELIGLDFSERGS